MRSIASDEAELLARFQGEGDHASFEALVRLHLPMIRRFIATRLPDRDEAEEAEQDLLVRLYASLRNYRGGSALRTWIFRLCLAATADLVRRKARERARMLRFLAAARESEPRDSDRAEWGIERESEAALVRRCLERLGEPASSMVYLRDAEALSVEELSELFGLPTGTVKSRLSRARERLRTLLEAEGLGPVAEGSLRRAVAGGGLS